MDENRLDILGCPKLVNIYLSIKWYAPGAEFERPARVNRSRRDPPRCGARPDIPPLVNGFWNECFFNIVFIKINVSNFGMLLTTELTSSSLIWTRRQFSSSVGNMLVLLLVTHVCSFIFFFGEKVYVFFFSLFKWNADDWARKILKNLLVELFVFQAIILRSDKIKY